MLKHSVKVAGLLLAALFTIGGAWAAPLTYAVSISTTPQIGYLDFQFLPGPGAAPATVVINNFEVLGGGQLLDPVDTVFPLPFNTPTATGDLSSEVVIENSDAFNAWLQRIEFGSSVSFWVTLSGPGLNVPGNAGGTDFSVLLYDENGFDLLGGPAVVLAIDPDAVVGVEVAAGTTAQIVPEPGSLLLMTSGLIGVLAGFRKRRVA